MVCEFKIVLFRLFFFLWKERKEKLDNMVHHINIVPTFVNYPNSNQVFSRILVAQF